MYCQSCGAGTTIGLKYCKRCGASLAPPAGPDERHGGSLKLAGMFWAVAVLVLGGMSALFGGMVALAAVHVHMDALIILGSLASVTIFLIAALLIWQLARVVSIAKQAAPAQPQGRGPYPQGDYNAPQIAAPPAVMPSVTEHTTRNFEPAVNEDTTRNFGPARGEGHAGKEQP
jgi:hypothetical protein